MLSEKENSKMEIQNWLLLMMILALLSTRCFSSPRFEGLPLYSTIAFVAFYMHEPLTMRVRGPLNACDNGVIQMG
jgi:hypothetical protein